MPIFECPICAKSVTVLKVADAPFRPFCSQRCKMVDLGRWLDGTYRVSEPLPLHELENPLPEEDEAGEQGST